MYTSKYDAGGGGFAQPKKEEEDELDLYRQFLEQEEKALPSAFQNQREALANRDKNTEAAMWAENLTKLGQLAGGAIGGGIGGGMSGIGAGMAIGAQGAQSTDIVNPVKMMQDSKVNTSTELLKQGLGARNELVQMRDKERANLIEDERLGRERVGFDTQQKQAEQGYQMGEMQINKLQRDVQDEEVMRDPNSDISEQYRTYAEAAGQRVDQNLSAYQLQQQMPILQQMFQIDMQRQNLKMQQQAQAQQASQFNQTMDMNRQKQAYDAQMNQGVKERQLRKEDVELVKQISEKVLDNDVIKTAKKDADQMLTMLNTLSQVNAKGNPQISAKTVQTFEKLLTSSNDVEEATGRGIGYWQGVMEQVKDLVGVGDVPPEVINDMRMGMELLLQARADTIDREQSGTVEALEHYGYTKDDAKHYIVNSDKYRRK
jgi:hypothetical protein